MIQLRNRAGLYAVVLVVSLVAILVLAQSSRSAPDAASNAEGLGKIDPYSGSFSTSFPIEVPAYRGLEPKLGLAYDSSGGNGWLGVGWTLTGLSIIERAAPGRGAPKYDGNDIYLLDGVELSYCGASPCTTFGGNYRPRTENYKRIQYNSSGYGTWEVTDTNGTRSTYAALYSVGTNLTFRWALTTVQDTHGNVVTYHYWCQAGQNCYLNDISYNGVAVIFYPGDVRSDPFTFATGRSLAQTNYRLRTIEVKAGGNPVRAYRFTYALSGSIQRTLLASVQEYGRDYGLDTGKTVVSGTPLPPMTFGYQTPPTGFQQSRWISSFGINPLSSTDAAQRYSTGDFNGDGKSDLLYKRGSDSHMLVALSTGSAFVQSDWIAGGFGGAASGTDASSRYAVADFNGDGKSDLLYKNGNGHMWVALSTGSAFAQSDWTASFGFFGQNPLGSTDATQRYMIGDFNGDGKSDLLYKAYNNQMWVALSTGSSFVQSQWLSALGNSANSEDAASRYTTGDFNGDGKTDILYKTPAGAMRVALSTGIAFAADTDWSASFVFFGQNPLGAADAAQRYMPGDFNGDGKSDLLYKGMNNTMWVALSTGSSFVQSQWSSAFGNSYSRDDAANRYGVGEFNGDGRGDLFYKSPTGMMQVALSTGAAFAVAADWLPAGSYFGLNPLNYTEAGNRYDQGDFNGDGKGDLLYKCNCGSGADMWVALASGPLPDLLISVANGLGATTTVQYTPSSVWSNIFLPSNMQTVRAVTTTIASGTDTSTGTYTYAYQGGNWSNSERRFLGFRAVTTTLDTLGTYQVTNNHQSVNSIGKADSVYLKDSAGRIINYSVFTYVENSTPPFTSLLTQSSEYECNLSTPCRQILTGLAYDVYGNVTETDEYGDAAVSGDERATVHGFSYNTIAYIVGLPAYQNTFAGIGAGATLMAQTLNIYDANTSYNQAPTIGNLAKTQQRRDLPTVTYINTSMQFDAQGNITGTLDARGYTATVQFDPTYHLYPIRSCNALSQCTQNVYYGVNGVAADNGLVGQLKQVTDANNVTVSYIYDALGRKTSETDPGGTTTWLYQDWGKQVRQTLPDGSGDGLWSETYTDGLGRTYKTVKEGPSTGITYIQETKYIDASTRPDKQYLWHRSDESGVYEQFYYDAAGRLVQTDHPNGTGATTATYANDTSGKPYVRTYDELGHEKATWNDAYGRLIQVREKNGAAYYTTTYQYDVLGNLKQSTDANLNVTTMTYDSLGRKLSMTDPDMGYWTYDYDNGGLLSNQMDANGQAIAFLYDELGRVKTKAANGQTTTWSYDEAGYGSSVGRLTRVTYPNGTGSESHAYNWAGKEISGTRTISGISQTTQQTYDALQHLQTLTYPDGEVVTYAYNPDGYLNTVTSYSGLAYVTSMGWNATGQLVGMNYGNNTSVAYTYDPNRLWLQSADVELHILQRPDQMLYNATYSYDAAARVVTMTQNTRSGGITQLGYQYDDLNRLMNVTGAQPQSFQYDAIGNILENSIVGTYKYPGHLPDTGCRLNSPTTKPHALESIRSSFYRYDCNGNLTSDSGRTYTWDPENHVTSVTQGITTTTFVYDANGQRIQKTQGANTTLYFGLSEQVNGRWVQYYYAGPILIAKKQIDEKQHGVKTWYHSDRLGSIRLMTDASGAEVKDYDYKAFGDTQSQTGTEWNERTFTGHISDAETNLIYMGARYYDAALGRFISADTVIASLANPQSLNRYSYVYNNPVNNTDPTGHRACEGENGDGCSTQHRSTTPQKGITQKNGADNSKPQQAKSKKDTGGAEDKEHGGSPEGATTGSGGVFCSSCHAPRSPYGPEYNDWFGGKYGRCIMCHAAVAMGKTMLTNQELAATQDHMLRTSFGPYAVTLGGMAVATGITLVGEAIVPVLGGASAAVERASETPTGQMIIQTISGGVNVVSESTTVGGDLTGRDKIVQTIINNITVVLPNEEAVDAFVKWLERK